MQKSSKFFLFESWILDQREKNLLDYLSLVVIGYATS